MAGPLQVRGLFPTRVLAFDLEPADAAAFNAWLWAEIDRLLTPRPPAPSGQTWQTHHDLHLKPAFQPFVQLVQACARRWLEEFRLVKQPLAITGCWGNLNPPGLSHNAHNHPNNLISGVYYVRTGAGADVITFMDPRPQVLQVLPRFTQQTPLNATELNVPALEGRLVLFPGWLVHGVPSNRGNQERLSIAFNLTPAEPA
jgi:uncharacterized protein (TIGR02466 family)